VKKANVAHSVHQRLLNAARNKSIPFNALLQHYAIERFLYRISKSPYSKKLLLKGALLLKIWNVPIVRPTMDIDMLGKIESNEKSISKALKKCMKIKVEDDGLIFQPDTILTERITEDAEYIGIRAKFKGVLGKARINLQIDIGIGDEVYPSPVWIDYPTILENEKAHLLAYTPETSIAEKYQAMINLDMANSRMKDFFDIWLLANNLEFQGNRLSRAIKKTFNKRDAVLSTEMPTCFTCEFSESEIKQTQWNAFVNKIGLKDKIPTFPEVLQFIQNFLMPPTSSIAKKEPFKLRWEPKGPWL